MNNEALQHWLNTTTPIGSDVYYALRKLETDKQEAIKILLAVFDSIMSIPFVVNDDELVRVKLRWWKEEIIKTQQQQASHPLCVALNSIMERYALNYNAILQCISAIEDRVQQAQFPDEQSLRDYYTHTYGIRERMIAKILSPEAKQHSEAIHHLAYSLGLIDNLQHIRHRAEKTYVFFTDEEARKLHVDKNKILTMKISEDAKKLFQRHIEKAKQHFQLGLDLLGKLDPATKITRQQIQRQKKNFLPLTLRAYLAIAWCDLVSEEQFPLFTHQIELTPLRRWWLSRKFINKQG